MLYKLIQEYDEMFGERSGGILQSLDEIEQLVAEIGTRKFYNMAEIGSYRGGTLWLYSQLFAADGALFTIVDIKINPIVYDVIHEIYKRKKIAIAIIERHMPAPGVDAHRNGCSGF